MLIICLDSLSFGQSQFYSCNEDGEIVRGSIGTCYSSSLGIYPIFNDIAKSDNGDLYGISDKIYMIDTLGVNAIPLTSSLDGNGPIGAGFTSYKEFLLFDVDDSLYSFSTVTGQIELVGKIGYFCNGDFAFKGKQLYMISELNHLILIELNDLGTAIQDVSDIGIIASPIGLAFGLFSLPDCQEEDVLFFTESNRLYKIELSMLQITEVCTLSGNSLGATALEAIIGKKEINIPNVITANHDMINDEIDLLTDNRIESFCITNRWGNVVYQWKEGNIFWNGMDVSGKACSSGTYIYYLKSNDCNTSIRTGFIQIIGD